MRLDRPRSPFQKIKVRGESVTLDVEGKNLVLPTGNAAILPRFNECTLDSNRLTIAESPFGGLKGSGSPDFAVGTLYTATDGIYLTDTSGTNSTKTLTAGKLKELSLLTVDTAAHSITEEFVIANTATSNNPTVIDACDSTTGWSGVYGSNHTIEIENGMIKVTGTTDSSGRLTIQKTFSAINCNTFPFISVYIKCAAYNTYFLVSSVAEVSADLKYWAGSRFPCVSNRATYV
jgi:hypothetical protein